MEYLEVISLHRLSSYRKTAYRTDHSVCIIRNGDSKRRVDDATIKKTNVCIDILKCLNK